VRENSDAADRVGYTNPSIGSSPATVTGRERERERVEVMSEKIIESYRKV
jgi:hypothetical protein